MNSYECILLLFSVFFYRPVFSSGGTIDSSSEFSPLFRQERERLTDDDLLKYLSDFKKYIHVYEVLTHEYS